MPPPLSSRSRFGTLPVAATGGLANAVFFHPASGVTGADALVHVEVLATDETGDREPAKFSPAEHHDLTASLESVAALAGHSGASGSISARGVEALYADQTIVTREYFDVLGMRLAAGRPFAPEDDRAPGVEVVIVGHALARALFGDPEQAPGRVVLVNGRPSTVIGVAPRGFHGLKTDHYSQLWLPAASDDSPIFEEFIGRLAEDVRLEQVRAELMTAARAVSASARAGDERFRALDVRVERQPGMSFSGGNTRDEVLTMFALFAGGGTLLLLLAGANVGNLFLFCSARRRDELAMRAALGASRWRLLRAHLIEISMLSLLGGTAGLALTWTLGRLLEGVVVRNAGFLEVPIDWRVGGLVLAGVMAVGIAFGGAPVAAASSRGGLALGARSGHYRGHRLRSALTVAQLGLSLSLLVGAGLLLATIRNLSRVDTGFDPAPLVSATVMPGRNGYDNARTLAFYRHLLTRAAASPAVASVSLSDGAPIVGAYSRERAYLPGRDPAQAIAVRASIDPAMPLPRRLTDEIDFEMAGRRILSSVLATIAALGLLMAAVGLFGLVAETVVDRTREFAIRMAVGAAPGSIAAAAMRRAIVLAAIGIVTGIVLSAGLSHALRSQLFGVSTLEPWVYLSTACVFAGVVLLASLAPAIRAIRVNPLDALRTE